MATTLILSNRSLKSPRGRWLFCSFPRYVEGSQKNERFVEVAGRGVKDTKSQLKSSTSVIAAIN